MSSIPLIASGIQLPMSVMSVYAMTTKRLTSANNPIGTSARLIDSTIMAMLGTLREFSACCRFCAPENNANRIAAFSSSDVAARNMDDAGMPPHVDREVVASESVIPG